MYRRNLSLFLMHNAYGKFLQTFIRGLPRFGVLQPNSDVSQYFIVLDDTRKLTDEQLIIF